MLSTRRFVIVLLAWAAAVTSLHFWLNVQWADVLNDRLPKDQRKFNVAYIPVT